MADDDDFQIKGHVPAWLRNAIAGAILFFAGNGVAGSVMYKGASADEMRDAVRTEIASAIQPVKNQLDDVQRRQTDVEGALSAYRSRMAEIERKLPTRNR